jgi:hypothetical protein
VTDSPFDNACPKCGQRAPIVLRGLDSRCAACGAPRFLLAAPNVSLAGQPSRVGGIAATIAGTSVLVLGLSLALGLWFVLQGLSPMVGWGVAIPVAAASLLFGLLLLLGGSRLRKHGAERQEQVQLDAVKALLKHRRGPISALEAAGALELPEAQVDAILTRLAREQATAVTVDVDEHGHVVYDFDGEARRWRVLEEDLAGEGRGPRPRSGDEAADTAAPQRHKR